MNDKDQYGRYMAQQPQHIPGNENTNGNYTSFGNTQSHPDADYAQSSTGFAGQQQVMYGEYAHQSQHGEGEYRGYEEYGAQEYYAGSGEKLRPVQPVRRRGRWFWPILVLTLLLVMMVGSIFGYRDGHDVQFDHGMMGGMQKHGFMRPGDGVKTDTQQVNLPTGMTPTLTINDTNGSVLVNAANGMSNVVTITVNSQSGDNTNDVAINLDKQHGVLSINTTNFSDVSDIVVTTPSNVNVQVQSGSGDVQLQNITGQVNVQDNDGAVRVDKIIGNVAISTVNGSISANAVSGQVNLTSQDGDINLTQMALNSQSSLKSQSGSISFAGSLDLKGSYTFETISGDIHLALPSDASFHLVNTPNNMHNDFNGSDVGSSPRPSLNVSSQSGDIRISQGQ